MTKQEEIREGIERFLIAEVAEPIHPKKLAKLIMHYLHSQGVVIKKE